MVSGYLLLVLQPMPAALHVHLLGVGVVELAVAQLAVEADGLAVVAADLLDVVLPHGLHLGLQVLVLLVLLLIFVPFTQAGFCTANCTQTPGRHERYLRRSGDRSFWCVFFIG